MRLDLASVRLLLDDRDGALAELREAVRRGAEPVRRVLRADPRFAPLSGDPAFRRLSAPALR